jgi:energy-converting hydrogenase Eha subunit C
MTEALVRLRRLLLVALLAGVTGTAAELVLLGHTEGWQQIIPIALLALAFLAVAWHRVRPGRAAQSAMRVVMWLCVISGGVGVVLHYQGNAAFELEMYPEMRGVELFQETMTGATPVLAPGTMALLGLVGLAYLFVSMQIPNRYTQSEAQR